MGCGLFCYGTGPQGADTYSKMSTSKNKRPCVIASLLELDTVPARMTIFVDGEPLAEQCEYEFPKDGRAWFPSVSLGDNNSALHSCAI
jgi:hypothetical protein